MAKSIVGLLVVNQDVDFKLVQKIIQSSELNNFVLLSTHYYFFTEKRQLQNLTKDKNLIFIDFGEFLSDDEMLDYDKLTFESLTINSANHWESPRMHKHVMVYLRNKRIHEELLKLYDIDKIFYWSTLVETYNLGISNKYWAEVGAKRLIPPPRYHWVKRLTFIVKKLKIFESFGLSILKLYQQLTPRVFYLVDFEKEHFIFHSLRRLHFQEDVVIQEVKFNPIKHLSITRNNSRDKVFERFVKHIAKSKGIIVHWATALHEYPKLRQFINAPEIPLFIFEDAFRPSNYPEFVYSRMIFLGKIIVRDMYDYAYFKGSGKEVIKPYGPLKISYFNIEGTEKEIYRNPKVVVLSINHTGDWTFLINRSDTDKLIEHFALLAKENETLQFIIRPHPTMNTAIAEGTNSVNRIKQFVSESGIENLSVSNVSLDRDWERGDIFISEYSLSVLDAMRKGKLGFFMNPTSRRSFVQDFVDIGFPQANSYDEMSNLLNSMVKEPDIHRERIVESAKRYNVKLRKFLSSP